MARFCWLLLAPLVFVYSAHAQLVRSRDITSQVFVPGPQTAANSDAWSLFVNPAGMAYVEGAQLVGGYTHMWRRDLAGLHQGQAGLAFNIFDGLSLGLGLHLGLPSDPNNAGGDKGQIEGNFGLAFHHKRYIAVGVSAIKQRRYALPEADPFIFTLGLQSYPTSWLALGAVASQVYGSFGSPLEFRFGAAFRPFGEAFSISADARLWPKQDSWQQGYHVDPQLAARVDFGGFSVLANAIVPDIGTGFKAPVLLFGVEFNLENFGVSLLGGGQPPLEYAYVGGRFRMSSEEWPTLVPAKHQWLSFAISGDGVLAAAPASLAERLLSSPMKPMLLLDRLSKIADDDRVDGVIVRLDNLTMGFARAKELRDVLLQIKNAGKKVVVHFNSADKIDYFIASVADRIYLSPAGEIELGSFRSTLVYLNKGLADLGINAEAVSAGRYKSAIRAFTANEPNAEEREVTNAILDQNHGQMVEALASRLKSSQSVAKESIDLGSLVATEAKDRGLVDGLAYASDLNEILARDAGLKAKPNEDYFATKKKQSQWGERPQIAVIPISGAIVQGHVQPGLFDFSARVGADDVVMTIEKAAQSNNVVAIVLRIESPGGDALASDLIYDAVMKARRQKPVLASMGDVAASGGYYIAAAADRILAEPSTLTGSIGVFSLHFSVQKLSQKLGVSSFEFAKSKVPGPSLLRGFSPEEKARAQTSVDWHYKKFQNAVATGQNLTTEQVAKAAEGHVWTGQQALELKLVHELGGFNKTVSQAKLAAGYSEGDALELAYMETSKRGAISVTSLAQAYATSPLMHIDAALTPIVAMQGKPLALMPFYLE